MDAEVNRNDTKTVVSKLNTGKPEHVKGTNKKNRQHGGIMGDRVLMVLASKEAEMAREEGGTVFRIAQWQTPLAPLPSSVRSAKAAATTREDCKEIPVFSTCWAVANAKG